MQESELEFYPELIEHRGQTIGEKPYILYEDQVVTYGDFDRATCRAANGLAAQGARPGDGVAILMGNCPEYLYLFYGLPRGGFYSVPINVALKGDGLRFILTNSDVKHLIVDDVLLPKFAELEGPVGGIEKVFVRRTTDKPLPSDAIDLDTLLDASSDKPDYKYDPEAVNYLMYTSGTTGFPKGVVNRASGGNVQGFLILSNI